MISSRTKAAFIGLAAVAALGMGVTQAISDDETSKPAKSASACVDGNSLTTRMVVDSSTLFIEDISGRGAILEMAGPCRAMQDLDQIGLEFTGSSYICGRTDVKIIHNAPGGNIPVRCIVKTFTPLDREEAKAYVDGLKRK